MNSPHNLRNIPRIVLVLLIIAAFGMAISKVENSPSAKTSGDKQSLKGVRTQSNEFMNKEIERTLKVVQVRPDYAGAWMRLAVLYEQMGETDKADEARSEVRRLNPEL